MTALARCTGSTFHNGSPTSCACWRIKVFMVWHRTAWPVSACELQRSVVVLGCDHRMTINCSSHGHVGLHLLLVRAPSTPPDQHPGKLYQLRFVIRQSHWEHLGRCWSRFCCDWQMCIGHGIRVAACAFVTFVKGRLKCLLLLSLMTNYPWSGGVVRVTWPKFKIWDTSISFERIKIRAPNFVQLHIISAERNWPIKRRGLGHVTL